MVFPINGSPCNCRPQDLNPEVDKPGKRKKLDATARGGSEDREAPPAIDFDTTESSPLQPAGGELVMRGEKVQTFRSVELGHPSQKFGLRPTVLIPDSVLGTC